MAKIYDDLSAIDIDTIDLTEAWGAYDRNIATKDTKRIDLFSVIDKANSRLKSDGSWTGTPVIDLATRPHRKGTLTGNIVPTFNDPLESTRVIIIFVQDATGSRTVSFVNMARASGSPMPYISPIALSVSILEFYFELTSAEYTFQPRPLVFLENSIPPSASVPGLYQVQQGASTRGLYTSSGVGAPVLITPFFADGDWPV